MSRALHRNPKLEIRPSAIHRWGVFANARIKKGELLEECPCWRFDMGSEDLGAVRYYWPKDAPWETYAVVAGLGMVYNHGDRPNATWRTDDERDLFVFTATRAIAKGEEVTISYGEDYDWDADIDPFEYDEEDGEDVDGEDSP